jgi:uncharacterized damage-inducible protein DinB
MKIMLQTMSRYNSWMNGKLYAVCATMPDELRKEDRGAWFRSMHGTLNHLLLADRLWMGRFTGNPFPARSLDQELFSDFQELWRARRETDEAITAWVEALTEERLMAPFTYTTMTNPQQITQPLWQAALHCFNHQTHHRGQLTTLMEQAGYDSGVTDLLWMLRDEE